MKIFITIFCLAAIPAMAANPTFQSFNTNQFVADAANNTVRANTNSENPGSLVSQAQLNSSIGTTNRNRYTTNTDAVASLITPQIHDPTTNTQLTLKFFGTNGTGGFRRSFLNFENTNTAQAGFHIMSSQETSDSTLMMLLDADAGNPSSLLNIANFNQLFTSIADSSVFGTPPGFLGTGVACIDSSIFGILNLASASSISQMDTSGFSTLASSTNAFRTIAHGFNVGVFFDSVADDVLIGDSVMAGAGGASKFNVMLGSTVGSQTTLATTNCIILGYDTDPPVDGGGNQLNILGTIFGTGMPFRPRQGVGTGKVGINIKAPSQALDVNGLSRSTGFVTASNSAVASAAITFPATTALWTNTFGINIVLYIDNTGVTGTALAKNGQQIFSSLIGDMTVLFKPGDYFSQTYTVGTPTARWEPR